MLKTIDLINKLSTEEERKKYGPMLSQVYIPDFTKCISQFSGLPMTALEDDLIAEYLLTWAKNKYKFWKLLNNQIHYDIDFTYYKSREDIVKEMASLEKEYPTYFHWLKIFDRQRSNSIDPYRLTYADHENICILFPNIKLQNMKVTHFFNGLLNAPSDLVTKLAAIFENDEIVAKYTISIDPVDMMTASENPFDWTSCYKLALGIEDSHADGCLAAILDTSSLITYVWKNEGKLKLYKYELKNNRYKIMREWISIEPTEMKAVYFNTIYPGKIYEEEFCKQMREPVEELVAKYHNLENIWYKNFDKESDPYSTCDRAIKYGYDEYGCVDPIFILKDENGKSDYYQWEVYNVNILCPLHYKEGKYLLPLGGDENEDAYQYNGLGFISDNISTGYWCPLRDYWCPYGYNDCEECCEDTCEDWKYAHPYCVLAEDECPTPDYDRINSFEGIVEPEEDHCNTCPHWNRCHAAIVDEE